MATTDLKLPLANHDAELATAQEQIHMAMARLEDDELTAEYRQACRFVPELVEKESDPRWFLSFHPNDPNAAATRLANYWKKRQEIFQERVFLPINLSGNGALMAEDIRILKTGYIVNLPRDKKGRSVLYTDISKKSPDLIPSRRIMFFLCQMVMENEKSQQQCCNNNNSDTTTINNDDKGNGDDGGFVVLRNVSNPFAANSVKVNNDTNKVLIATCMPIRTHTFHLLYVAPPGMNFVMPLFINTVFTWAVNFLMAYFGNAIIAHIASSKEDCLAKLLPYDFEPEGLPVSLGGTWTGGCEPWRRRRKGCSGSKLDRDDDDDDDDDELVLEIEADLSCLSRNALWFHNQAMAATHHPAAPALVNEAKEVDSVSELHDDEEEEEDIGSNPKLPASTTTTITSTATSTATTTTTTTTGQKATAATTKPPPDRPGRTRDVASSIPPTPKRRAKSVDGSRSSAKKSSSLSSSGRNKKKSVVVPSQPKVARRARSLERPSSSSAAAAATTTTTPSNRGGFDGGDHSARQQLEQSTFAAAAAAAAAATGGEQKDEDEERMIGFPVATLPRGEQPPEELQFRRQRDVVYSKRKRERKRIEVEELQKQELHLSAWNHVLRNESRRLEELLRNAQQEIRRRNGGSGGGGGGGGSNEDAPIA